MQRTVSSPHSGENYPADFIAASRLDRLALRRSEDSFVDELFAAAPALGAPLIRALFPRAYVDPNREAWELDPAMFAEALPDFVNTGSLRVRVGLGTIARVVANGTEIYRDRLSFDEARTRIETLYMPYHRGLAGLVDATHRRFGHALSGDRTGLWRYRVGDYRIVAAIEDDRFVVLVVTIGHRREVYR